MRIVIVAIPAVFVWAGSVPAQGATQSTGFGVGVTVIAACTVSMTALVPRSGTQPATANACAASADPRAIPAPPPTVGVVPDPTTGLSKLVVEF